MPGPLAEVSLSGIVGLFWRVGWRDRGRRQGITWRL